LATENVKDSHFETHREIQKVHEEHKTSQNLTQYLVRPNPEGSFLLQNNIIPEKITSWKETEIWKLTKDLQKY
jgi:hypothetical protein